MNLIMTMFATFLSLAGCIGAGRDSDVTAIPPGGNDCQLSSFPEVIGIDLHGVERTVPADLSGDVRLVISAYLREQQDDVDTWIDRLPQIERRVPGIAFYELPVITKSSPLFRAWLNNGMRSGIPDDRRRGQVITVYTDVQAFLDATDQADTSTIGVFLVNRDGCILARTAGRYSDEKLDWLIAQLASTPGGSDATMTRGHDRAAS